MIIHFDTSLAVYGELAHFLKLHCGHCIFEGWKALKPKLSLRFFDEIPVNETSNIQNFYHGFSKCTIRAWIIC